MTPWYGLRAPFKNLFEASDSTQSWVLKTIKKLSFDNSLRSIGAFCAQNMIVVLSGNASEGTQKKSLKNLSAKRRR